MKLGKAENQLIMVVMEIVSTGTTFVVFFVNLLQTAPFSGANIGVTGFVRMLWVQNVTY